MPEEAKAARKADIQSTLSDRLHAIAEAGFSREEALEGKSRADQRKARSKAALASAGDAVIAQGQSTLSSRAFGFLNPQAYRGFDC